MVGLIDTTTAVETPRPRAITRAWNPQTWSPVLHAGFFGILAFVLRIPFLFRYDLHFAGDSATCYLMALRITRGDRPFYFYGQDYQGALEAYLAAPLVKAFGPSIPIVAIFSLFEWSLATGIGIYLARRAGNPMSATIAGIVTAVGVPFTLHFVTVPFWGYPGSLLIAMLVLLEALLMIERGPSLSRVLVFGGTVGVGLYVGKQCIPAVLTALVAMAVVRTARWNLREALRPAYIAAAAVAAAAGYLPEIVYRLQHPQWRSFFRIASFPTLRANAENVVWSIAAYFDAQPVSRMPEGTHFFSRSPTSLVFPADTADTALLGMAAATLLLAATGMVRAYARGTTASLLLGLALFANIAAVVASRESGGWFINTRRYLYPSAILFSIWTGFLMATIARAKWKPVSACGWLLLTLFVGRVGMHEYRLLSSEDELRELRSIVQDLRAQGLTRGVASWGYALTIDALTNEQIVIAAQEGGRVEEYDRRVSEAERIAVIGPNDNGVAKDVVVRGSVFSAIAAPHQGETLQWAVYRKRLSTLDP